MLVPHRERGSVAAPAASITTRDCADGGRALLRKTLYIEVTNSMLARLRALDALAAQTT